MSLHRYAGVLCAIAVGASGCAPVHSGVHIAGIPIVQSASSQFPVREWSKLSQEQKVGVISGAIDLARQEGTQIHLPPGYFVAEIDALRETYVKTGNDNALESSVGVTFKTIAVMEGDWGNGEKKVEQARRVCGPYMFEEFKTHYPDKYQHLEALDEQTDAGASAN